MWAPRSSCRMVGAVLVDTVAGAGVAAGYRLRLPFTLFHYGVLLCRVRRGAGLAYRPPLTLDHHRHRGRGDVAYGASLAGLSLGHAMQPVATRVHGRIAQGVVLGVTRRQPVCGGELMRGGDLLGEVAYRLHHAMVHGAEVGLIVPGDGAWPALAVDLSLQRWVTGQHLAVEGEHGSTTGDQNLRGGEGGGEGGVKVSMRLRGAGHVIPSPLGPGLLHCVDQLVVSLFDGLLGGLAAD